MDLPELPGRSIRLMLVAAFAVIALAVYGVSLKNGFVHWDDGLLIYQNPAVMETSLSSIKRAFTTYDPELYIPFTLLSYQADYLVGHGSAFPFHAQNLFWQTLNALLVAWLAFLLFKNRLIAVVIGLIFLVHPLHTEAVAWASGRKDVLAAFFFLSSLVAYLYWNHRDARWMYFLSIVLFACGLLSKVIVITLPVVLALLLWREKKLNVRSCIVLLPYFVLSFIFGIVALFGKTEVNAASSLLQKILMACKSSVFYLEKLFWPADLSVLYPFPDTITITSPAFYVPIILLCILAAITVISLRYTREIAVWFCFYLLTLAPTFINFVKVDNDFFVASDRYAYIPSVGVLLLLAWAISSFLKRDRRVKEQQLIDRSIGALASVILLILASLSYRQSLVWHDTLSLFRQVIDHAPAASYEAHANVGNVYRMQKQYEKAIEEYQTSISIKPHSRTYSNLGAAYRQLGQFEKAHQAYEEALRLNPQSPVAYFGEGIVYAAEGKYEQAMQSYKKALDLSPDAVVYVNIGALEESVNHPEDALAAYKKAIELDPFTADAYYNLAVLYTRMQRGTDAVDAYLHTIDLQPRFTAARINLAVLYAQMGEREKAIGQFKAILNYDPQNSTALKAVAALSEQ